MDRVIGLRRRAVPAERAGAAGGAGRLASIDALRGLAMVVMALDHVRLYAVDFPYDPVDLAVTDPWMFATRWVTHFVAPAFVLLAGTAAFLSGQRRGPDELARFLATRGLWLVLLEVTVITFAFQFALGPRFLQVIWAIGIAMLALAPLVWARVPSRAIGALGLLIVVGHNALDGIAPDGSPLGALWALLHVPSDLGEGPLGVRVQYPALPWIGVLFLGYALGGAFLRPAAWRRRVLPLAGLAMLAAFALLRALNAYGDPVPWTAWQDPAWTAMSFLNVTKYPPSLLFLLVTLGPALLALPPLERLRGLPVHVLATFGRVPLFYYVLHLYLAHLLMVPLAMAAGLDPAIAGTPPWTWPLGYGVPLPFVCLLWAGLVLAMFPLCAWFAEVKRTRREWWLSYL